MSMRELIALGTSSQVPTRERSQNAYVLRWDGEAFLLDPGEGAQRQLTLAGIAASSIHTICISHFHGDHCLGLAGVVQRLAVDHCRHPVHIYFPESGQGYLQKLCSAAIFKGETVLVPHPVCDSGDGLMEIGRARSYRILAHPLQHSVPTLGYRVEALDSMHLLPDKLAAAGIQGARIGVLQREGRIEIGDRTVGLQEVSVPQRGSAFAFVMDTAPCSGALALAQSADLLLMEATYLTEHRELAARYGHSTAADAAATALRAGVRQLALGHFSQRYRDTQRHLREARQVFPQVRVLNDLDRVEIPRHDLDRKTI